MNEIPAEEIERIVLNQIDESLIEKETEIANSFGAVKYESVEEKLDRLDKGKEEEDEPEPESNYDSVPIKVDEPVEMLQTEKTRTKQNLIADILKMQEKLEENEYTEATLKRKKKIELMEIAGAMFDRSVRKLTGIKKNPSGNYEISPETTVNLMYLGNLIFTELAEKVSETYKSSTYDVAIFAGWKGILEERRESFIQILSAINKKYGKSLECYMDPLVFYGLFMLETGGQCALKNFNQKKKD